MTLSIFTQWRILLWALVLISLTLTIQEPVHAQDSRGDMFISSRGTNSIKRYDGQTGELISTFVSSSSGGLVRPQEVIFGPDGHLYVVGIENDAVKKYDKETGEYLGDFSTGYALDNPTKMTFHSDGMIYISQWGGNQKVIRFDVATGAYVDEFTSTSVLNGCGHAWDAEGNLYVASWGSNGSNGSVHKFNSSGEFQGIFIPTGSGGLSGPVNLWFRNGDLFVVDWTQGDVYRYDGTTGEFKETFISGMVRTEGFTFDEDGFIYLADWQLNRINRYDSTGTFVDTFVAGGLLNPNSVTFAPVESSTTTNSESQELPSNLSVHQNYPNPFSKTTNIEYTLHQSTHVTVSIYDAQGKRLKTLTHSFQNAGPQTVTWDGRDGQGHELPSGTYFYTVTAGEKKRSQQLILLR